LLPKAATAKRRGWEISNQVSPGITRLAAKRDARATQKHRYYVQPLFNPILPPQINPRALSFRAAFGADKSNLLLIMVNLPHSLGNFRLNF